MSSTSTIGESGKISGQKRSFSRTCSLLSQYVKEKRATGGATMNLFPVKTVALEIEESNACVGKTIDLFPQISGFNSSMNKRASPEPQTPQMTIFYGGQVLVFNDLPADKAKEVMDLATSFGASLKKTTVEITNSPSPNPVDPNPNSSLNGTPKFADNIAPPVVPNVSDLPIARKASLHRFLEKRKDRLCANSPRKMPMDDHRSPPNARLGLN